MLNLHELEQRWLRYKIKSYLPYIVIVISISVILFTLLVFLREPTTSITKPKSQLPVTPKKHQVEKKPIVVLATQKEEKTLHSTANKVLLSPSLGFMKRMQTNQQPYYRNENSNKHSHIQVKVPTVKIVQKDVQKIQVAAVKKIRITHKNTYNDIAEVISRFKKNNNPALSLFVAKKYYELGDYRQAYNYALITNQINQDIEVSWIIFIKSLVKLGEKKKAIKTLNQYIKQSHSNSAQILLDEIVAGKFK